MVTAAWSMNVVMLSGVDVTLLCGSSRSSLELVSLKRAQSTEARNETAYSERFAAKPEWQICIARASFEIAGGLSATIRFFEFSSSVAPVPPRK